MSPVNAVRCWSGGGPQNTVWNWGDAISPTLYQHVSGRAPKVLDYTELTSEPHLIICGSTLKWITAGSIVWGTGEIADGMTFMAGDVKPLWVAAVRGPMTRARLIASGIDCPDVYGDPALLFPTFYKPEIEKRYRLGVVPHYIDATMPFLDNLAGREDVKVIDITGAGRTEKVYSFIDEVLACERIVSSSLHGLILADAYGIPTLWARFSSNVFGDGFKFGDYNLSVGRDPALQVPTGPFSDPEDAIAAVDRMYAANGPITFDPGPLLRSFPDH